ncbi:MAG: hypothetical protein GY895_11875 [Phycisphaera sp.]|nr:hypothetical protein [Phycisphaera sp.]
MRRIDSAVIGDVHGCADELEELLEVLLERTPERRLRLVGDLLTKGPDPLRVISLIRRLQASGVDVQSVCGNHDLRLLAAMFRHRNGGDLARIPRLERETIRRLGDEAGRIAAMELLFETVNRIRCTAGSATVVHGGIDPERGLEATSPHELVHRKARSGQRHWWEDYRGGDGLIIVGHKPVKAPVRMTHEGRPVAVNVDTGCVGGGRLTAYLVEADEFIAVESRQVPKRSGECGIARDSDRSHRITLAG